MRVLSTCRSEADYRQGGTGNQLGGVALSKRRTTPCGTGILPVLGLAILGKRRPALAVPNWLLLWQDLNHRSTLAKAICFPPTSIPRDSQHRVAA